MQDGLQFIGMIWPPLIKLTAASKRNLTGKFVVSKTRNSFSSMGIDQSHEQLNTVIKGDEGAFDLTEDPENLTGGFYVDLKQLE